MSIKSLKPTRRAWARLELVPPAKLPYSVGGIARSRRAAQLHRQSQYLEIEVDHRYPEDVREVFGWFGAACHNAQFFEGDLVTLRLAVAGRKGDATTLSALKDLEAIHSRKILGQLLVALREVEPVPREVESLQQRALELRNGLSHGFFWKRHARLMNPAACGEVVEELKRAAHLFDDASDATRQLAERSIVALGIDRESWRQAVEDELQRLYKSSNGA